MPEGSRPIYRFDDVEIDVEKGTVFRNGEAMRLRQKTFQVLAYLVEHQGKDVSKDQIIKDVWRETAVVDDVLVQSITDIRRALDDDLQRPKFIRTIPKFGYRFIGRVEKGPSAKNTQTPGLTTSIQATPLAEPVEPIRRPVLWAALLVVVGLLVMGVALRSIWNESNIDPTVALSNPANKPSLAIMFFENRSGDADLDWLREGIADMLITDLSRYDALAVLSRGQLNMILARNGYDGSTGMPLDRAVDMARQGKTLNVATGSFARLGERIRIDVQLYDTSAGKLSGTESLTLDRKDDLLKDIGILSMKIAARLGGERSASERHGFTQAMTADLEAYRQYSLGVEKSQALHNTEAIADFEKAIDRDPGFAMAYARIGYTYAVTWNLPERGKPYLEKAFGLSGRLSEMDRLNISAWFAIANADYPAAINEFRQIVAKYPLDTEGHARLARLLQGEGQIDEAVTVLKNGLTIDGNAKMLVNNLGGLLSVTGRHDEAIAAHRRYVALAPLEPNAYDSLALTYQWAGDYDAAVANYEHALKLNPHFMVAIIHLGNARFQMGQYQRAVELFQRYIANAPSDEERSRGYASLSVVYQKKNDLEVASRYDRELRKIKPDWSWNTAMIAIGRGDKNAAHAVNDSVLAGFPFASRGSRTSRRGEFYYRGYFALKQGRSEDAIGHFGEAVRQLPQSWDIDAYEDCLARAYFELGRIDEAISEYERILRANPNYPLARFHLAEAYERKGMRVEARNAYESFLQNWGAADRDLPEVIAANRSMTSS